MHNTYGISFYTLSGKSNLIPSKENKGSGPKEWFLKLVGSAYNH